MLLVASTLFAHAQIESGGFGHFQTGPTTGNFNKMENYLSGISNLSPSTISRGGMLAGGAGYGIVRNVLIGGQGLAANYVVSGSDNANISISYGTGMFSMGYIVYATNKFFCYPYLGIGAGGYSISIENTGTDEIPFAKDKKVATGETKTFSLGHSSYDLGFSIKGLPFSKKDKDFGGFMLGVELGAVMGVPTGNWTDDKGKSFNGPPVFGQFNPYLRITIGGGGGKLTVK